MMYRLSPSAKCSNAIRAVRLGSYSMCATVAGTPSFSERRKSISRYARLWPPPWCRAVTRPCTLRPPLECSGRTSDFSGVSRVISAKSLTEAPRRPGVVGFYLRIPILSPYPCSSDSGAREDVDRLAVLGQRDDGALGRLALAVPGPGALALALSVDGVHRDDLDPVEDLLDGDLDLGLVRVGVDLEGVTAGLEQAVALLGNDRSEDDVARVADHVAASSSVVTGAVSANGAASATSSRALVPTSSGAVPAAGPATSSGPVSAASSSGAA